MQYKDNLQNMEDHSSAEHVADFAVAFRFVYKIGDFRSNKPRSSALGKNIRVFVFEGRQAEVYNLQRFVETRHPEIRGFWFLV